MLAGVWCGVVGGESEGRGSTQGKGKGVRGGGEMGWGYFGK